MAVPDHATLHLAAQAPLGFTQLREGLGEKARILDLGSIRKHGEGLQADIDLNRSILSDGDGRETNQCPPSRLTVA